MVLYFTAVPESKLTYISWKIAVLIICKLYHIYNSIKKLESDASAELILKTGSLSPQVELLRYCCVILVRQQSLVHHI